MWAGAGGLPRLVANCSMQVASDIALTGRRVPVDEAFKYGLVNRISKSPESLIPEALDLAEHIASLSPDSTIITRYGLRQAWKTGNLRSALDDTRNKYYSFIYTNENLAIGMSNIISWTRIPG
jgi:enoyl-CoA hydratase/carnithine racemase